jgi:hypothetical protein
MKNLTLLVTLCCAAVGCSSQTSSDLVSEIFANEKKKHAGMSQDVTSIARKHLAAGTSAKDARALLERRGFKVYQDTVCNPPCTRRVLASFDERHWYQIGYDEIRLLIEMQDESVLNVRGYLFHHTL